jgi:MFS family permease
MATFAMDAGSVIRWSVVPGIVSVALAVVASRMVAPPPGPAAAAPPADLEGMAPAPALIVLVLLFAALRMPETLFLLRLQDLGVAAPLIPMLWAVLHVVRTTASYPGGWLSDRMGPAATMLMGWALYAGVATAMALAAGPLGAVGAFLVLGLVSACTESPERALVAAWAGRARRGRGYGVYHAGVGIAALPGGLALGALYQWAGGSAAMAAGAGFGLLLALCGVMVLGLRPGR